MFFAPSGLPFLGSFTWATRPSASANAGNTFFCSDLSDGGIILASNGKVWRSPSGSPIRVLGSNLPVVIPSSGTMAANGAVTITTGLNAALATAPLWLFFPAGAVYAGSVAGLYYTQMATTTTGTVFDNVYAGGSNAAPVSPTPIVAAGPGAYTQSLVEITLFSGTLPGGLIGPNGSIQSHAIAQYTNSANAKTLRHKLGTTVYGSYTASTSASASHNAFIENLGAANRNIGYPNNQSSGFGVVGSALNNVAVNTDVDNTFNFTAQLALASETITAVTINLWVDPQ